MSILRPKNNKGSGIMGFLFSSKPSKGAGIDFTSRAMRKKAGYKRMRAR